MTTAELDEYKTKGSTTDTSKRTVARVAGFTLLFYVVVALTGAALAGRAINGEGIEAKLTSIAQHETAMGLAFIFNLLGSFSALVLAVTFYRLTCDQNRDIAMQGLAFRLAEGVIGVGLPFTLGLLWLATADGPNAPDAEAANGLGALLLQAESWRYLIAATFFAVGSTLFSYLFLRARTIPVPLARLGVFGSILLVVSLPAEAAGFIDGPVTWYVWAPLGVFELVLALWLLIKGVALPPNQQAAKVAATVGT